MSTKTTNSVNTTSPKRIAIVVANPGVSKTTGWPIGFWWSELTHPFYEFSEVGYSVEIFSPKGGKVDGDALSDPRDPSGYSAHDLITMGFVNTPSLMAMLDRTRPASEIGLENFDAIMITGGQSPMYTMVDDPVLNTLIRTFYEAGKITALLCHGVAALLSVKLSNGEFLIKGKTITGFANVEEDYADAYVGKRLQPFRIEDEAKKIGANFIQGGMFKEFAVRDGNLVTGQQNFSGAVTARAIIEALGL
jgi:putative intracellular protease/amidase